MEDLILCVSYQGGPFPPNLIPFTCYVSEWSFFPLVVWIGYSQSAPGWPWLQPYKYIPFNSHVLWLLNTHYAIFFSSRHECNAYLICVCFCRRGLSLITWCKEPWCAVTHSNLSEISFNWAYNSNPIKTDFSCQGLQHRLCTPWYYIMCRELLSILVRLLCVCVNTSILWDIFNF